MENSVIYLNDQEQIFPGKSFHRNLKYHENLSDLHHNRFLKMVVEMKIHPIKMWHELNQSATSAHKSHPQKFLNFEKVLRRKQGLSEGVIFTLNFI